MATPAIKYRDGNIFCEIIPYDRDWTSAIQAVIPKQSRNWTGEVWIFPAQFYNCVLHLTKHFYERVITPSSEVTEPQVNSWKFKWQQWKETQALGDAEDAWTHAETVRDRFAKKFLPHAALFVSIDAPREVIQAAYRALSKLYHPDTGGSEEKMKDLNAAYAELSRGWE